MYTLALSEENLANDYFSKKVVLSTRRYPMCFSCGLDVKGMIFTSLKVLNRTTQQDCNNVNSYC